MVEGLLLSSIGDALALFRRQPTPPEGNLTNPFKLVSTLEDPASVSEVEEAWRHRDLPGDAVDLWAVSRAARLFADVEYGQWGLTLLSPSASAARTAQECETRPSDLRSDDIVLGEFIGDQELLHSCAVGDGAAADSDRTPAGQPGRLVRSRAESRRVPGAVLRKLWQ
jgi:hypothetical protein